MAKAAVKAITPNVKPGQHAPVAEPPKADKTDKADGKAEPKAKKKKRGKLFWIGLILLAVAGTSATVAMMNTTGEHAAAEPPKAVEKPAVFVNLEMFTVNLQQEVGDQYLQVTLTVKATDEAVPEAMKTHMPEIRNHLLLLLSSKRASELLTVEGKVQLANEILAEVKKPLPEPMRASVSAVYFTSFVIQ